MSVVLIAMIAVVFGISSNVSAQSRTLPTVGGYKTMSVKDKQVVDATNFAVKTIAKNEEMELKLDSILESQVQVGQFFNFKMFFKVLYQDGGDDYPMCLTAQVSRSIKKEYKLVKWESAECPETEEK